MKEKKSSIYNIILKLLYLIIILLLIVILFLFFNKPYVTSNNKIHIHKLHDKVCIDLNCIDNNDIPTFLKDYSDHLNITYSTYTIKKPYSNIEVVDNANSTLVLVNKNNILPSTYKPKNLVKPHVDTSNYSTDEVHSVDKRIEPHLINLFKDAKDNGHNLILTSGYRSYKFQKELYNYYLSDHSIKETDEFAARPGLSEHQTGLAVDITTKENDHNQLPLEDFDNTKESIWVKDNAHKYGFIIRYHKGKENITGYQPESWHLRYVGIEVAKEMYNNNLTLEEYLFINSKN